MLDMFKNLSGVIDEVSKTLKEAVPDAVSNAIPETSKQEKPKQESPKQEQPKPKPVASLVSDAQISKLFPKHKDITGLTAALNKILPQYNILTIDQVCCFLGQCSHESAGFTVFIENLNYSAEGLCKTWPKRFTATTAGVCARNPEKIANKVYCDRMGNGPEASGDGWKYRGRGFIQLTGKDNYTKFSKSCGKSLDETVAYCETIEGAVASACWFWKENRLSERFIDVKFDFEGLTKAINGGLHGLDSRQKMYNLARTLLNS